MLLAFVHFKRELCHRAQRLPKLSPNGSRGKDPVHVVWSRTQGECTKHLDLTISRPDTYLRDAERIGPYLTLMRGRSFEEE
ncbi:hypothetical protein ACFVRC_47775, partial [Streptomyces sp. NPDC057889]